MSIPEPDAAHCPQCGAEVAARSCRVPAVRPVGARREAQGMSRRAEKARQLGDWPAALAAWRTALDAGGSQLPAAQKKSLPHASSSSACKPGRPRQPRQRPSPATSGTAKAGQLWRGSASWRCSVLEVRNPIAAFVLTKGKFLLLGLTKASTGSYSMFLSLGVYWTAWGAWKFALGLVLGDLRSRGWGATSRP